MHKKIGAGLIFAILVCVLAVVPARAFSLNGLAEDFKNLISPKKEATQNLTLDSKIELAEDGDVDKNGSIDSGDTVRFTYTLTNTTDKEHAFATLKTNIDRKQLNFIHNIKGSASLDDNGETITFPNFRIAPNQVATISFDARLNYTTTGEPTISTEADFTGHDNKSLIKALKKEIKVENITEDKIPSSMGQLKIEVNR